MWLTNILRAMAIIVTLVRFGESTTINIEQIVIGRCLYFQHVLQPGLFPNGFKNCTHLWILFREAFAYRNICNVHYTRYNKFVTEAFHTIPQDKAIFWENDWEFVKLYNTIYPDMMSFDYTLAGYMVSGLSWCGTIYGCGIDYSTDVCELGNSADNCSERAFYIAQSKMFSSNTKGKITIIFNGTVTPVFPQDGVFAKAELPNLVSPRVKKAAIIIVNDYGKKGKNCNDKSIKVLKNILTKSNKVSKITCDVNSGNFKYLLQMLYQNNDVKGHKAPSSYEAYSS